jgi:hypothetical protein
VGALAVACVPAAIAVAQRSDSIALIDASWAAPIGILAGISAIVLGTRARRRSEFTLGRVGGGMAGRIGRWLGIVGVYLALTAALAVGFYGVLTLLD